MKDLIVRLDLKTETWNIQDIVEYNPSTHIIFDVKQRDPNIVFNNLRFGFKLYKDGELIREVTEPPEGITFLSSDQDYLASIPIIVNMNTYYTLHLWVEESGKRYELDYNLEVPKPPKPFPSWEWKDNGWMSPVTRPLGEDKINYIWDESTLNWIPSLENDVWNPSTNQWEKLPDYDLN